MDHQFQPEARISRLIHAWVLVLIFVLLAVTVSIGGYLYYLSIQKVVKDRACRQLSAVADLKVGQIDGWRREMHHDAELLRSNPFFIDRHGHFSDSRIAPYLSVIRRAYKYRAIALLDPEGHSLVPGDTRQKPGPTAIDLVKRAARSGRVLLSDFHRIKPVDGTEAGAVQLDLVVPLGRFDGQRSQVAAVIWIAVDPGTFIYPLIQSWPGLSPSAETLLIRREGDEVVFLNELRHRRHTVLKLRLPMSQTSLPAVMAASGARDIVQGLDYRGIPVLAALRKIPETPWYMVSKVDVEEVYAPLRERAWLVAIAALLLILGAGGATLSLWYRQKAAFARSQLATERKRQALSDQYHRLTQYAEEMTLLKDSLQNANRDLEAFAYSVSHDLRSPLRGIDGYSKILLEDYTDRLDEDGRFVLGQVRAAAQEMGELIDDLLEYSRLGRCQLKMTTVDMTALFKGAFEEIQKTAPRRRLRLEMASLPFVSGDILLLRSVVRNLLDNAVKFTKDQDTAIITVGGRNGQEESKETIFFVRDNGVGFNMDYADKLFGVFQRLHPQEEFQGTGVGLANVQRIIQRHGGRVWAEANPDAGACFYFTIPRIEVAP
jgi:signal transduction histidine kinase